MCNHRYLSNVKSIKLTMLNLKKIESSRIHSVLQSKELKSTYAMKITKTYKYFLTGSIASAHSPCPLCRVFIRSGSETICTRSPTAKCMVPLSAVAETELLLAVFTFVKTAGLKVHL